MVSEDTKRTQPISTAIHQPHFSFFQVQALHHSIRLVGLRLHVVSPPLLELSRQQQPHMRPDRHALHSRSDRVHGGRRRLMRHLHQRLRQQRHLEGLQSEHLDAGRPRHRRQHLCPRPIHQRPVLRLQRH